MGTPRFQIGDRVTVKGGRSHVWRVVRLAAAQATDREPAYVLENSQRTRTAYERSLSAAPVESAADRSDWWERNRD